MTHAVRLASIVLMFSFLHGVGGSLFSPVVASPPEDSLAEKANLAFQAEEWEVAVQAYREIAKSEPDNGQAWFRLGVSQHRRSHFEKAAQAYLKANELGFAPARTRFNLGCAYARLSNKEASLKWLHQAIDAGFTFEQSFKEDEDLELLRGEDGFAEVLAHAAREAHPCRHGGRYREFDFWLGEWEVTVPGGQVAGHNRIEASVDGCLLQENWESARGGTGKSMNYYEPVSRTWKQLWVDSSGESIGYEGRFAEGAMRFEGEHYYRDGHTELSRMTFTPQADGTVRQFIEQSKDGGQSWYVWFDGTYARKQ